MTMRSEPSLLENTFAAFSREQNTLHQSSFISPASGRGDAIKSWGGDNDDTSCPCRTKKVRLACARSVVLPQAGVHSISGTHPCVWAKPGLQVHPYARNTRRIFRLQIHMYSSFPLPLMFFVLFIKYSANVFKTPQMSLHSTRPQVVLRRRRSGGGAEPQLEIPSLTSAKPRNHGR